MGSRNTASENMAPTATHVMSAPTATITQRYDELTYGDSDGLHLYCNDERRSPKQTDDAE
jgi:hypothetical protein